MKVIGGFWTGRRYPKNSWNCLDFAIVTSGALEYLSFLNLPPPEMSGSRARVLWPLRSLKSRRGSRRPS